KTASRKMSDNKGKERLWPIGFCQRNKAAILPMTGDGGSAPVQTDKIKEEVIKIDDAGLVVLLAEQSGQCKHTEVRARVCMGAGSQLRIDEVRHRQRRHEAN